MNGGNAANLAPRVVRIETYHDEHDQPERRGSAFFVSADLCVTAAHCIGHRQDRRLFTGPVNLLSGVTIDGQPAGTPVVAQLVGHDFDLDVAQLRVPDRDGLVGLAPGGVALSAQQRAELPQRPRWDSYGFSTANSTGLQLGGVLTTPFGNVEGQPALQLHCDQGGLGLLEGSSGSPVWIGERVVGVIRHGVLKQIEVMATALVDVAFPALRALLPEAAPVPVPAVKYGRAQVFMALRDLFHTDFDHVMFLSEAPAHSLPPAIVPQIQRAMALVDYFNSRGDLAVLVALIKAVNQTRPLRLFISYSNRDDELREELLIHLSLLRRQSLIESWHSRAVLAGDEWKAAVDELERSDIVLLLVTPSFMASPYAYDREMARAMELHDQKLARVIPILVRPSDWQDAPFSKLVALPQNGTFVTKWRDRDEAWLDVVMGIRRVAQSMTPRPDAPQAPARTTAAPPQPASAVPTRAEVLDQLTRLYYLDFNKIVFLSNVRALPAENVPQVERAMKLIEYFEASDPDRGLVRLMSLIRSAKPTVEQATSRGMLKPEDPAQTRSYQAPPSDDQKIPTVASLRKLVDAILPSSDDMDAFCVDHFRDVAGRFSSAMSRTAKVNLLLQYAPLGAVRDHLREDFPDGHGFWGEVSSDLRSEQAVPTRGRQNWAISVKDETGPTFLIHRRSPQNP